MVKWGTIDSRFLIISPSTAYRNRYVCKERNRLQKVDQQKSVSVEVECGVRTAFGVPLWSAVRAVRRRVNLTRLTYSSQLRREVWRNPRIPTLSLTMLMINHIRSSDQQCPLHIQNASGNDNQHIFPAARGALSDYATDRSKSAYTLASRTVHEPLSANQILSGFRRTHRDSQFTLRRVRV
ncbi:hypothetical protein AVEN_172302-1 [Araneus ventricosus]|uniref:Uncharacterized protein n=1 Tax=Araneus ventricosus TaxID=182803 RepID=A0A4Y2E3S6_ARAVE|nr:hypothetical protein AVEN_172302-1 [Araneus ventricosus]